VKPVRDVQHTEIPFKQSLISDKISNIVMPDLIRHPEYNDLDCGFRLEKPPAFAGMTGKRNFNKFDIP
jgi:hypothetical protein